MLLVVVLVVAMLLVLIVVMEDGNVGGDSDCGNRLGNDNRHCGSDGGVMYRAHDIFYHRIS